MKLIETSGKDEGRGESDKHALLLVSLHILWWWLGAMAGCYAIGMFKKTVVRFGDI